LLLLLLLFKEKQRFVYFHSTNVLKITIIWWR